MMSSGLTRGKARMVYAKAQEYAMSASHCLETIWDVMRGQFKDIAVSNLSPQLVNDLREIVGFDDLFGPQDFCGCEECRSILSPAAYFVDLMYFIEQHVSKPVFIDPSKTNHPLYLKNRRGDLWQLRLTCENTHTLIPYLTIVNEVLETYLERVVTGNIYEKLSDPADKRSFGLPFNLPLEEARLYLRHFGLALHDIYRILKQPEAKIWRARLSLSKDEFEVITVPDPAGVKFRFGDPASFVDFEVQEFIRLAGISRQQLDDLLALRFNPDLSNIKVDKKSVPGELQNFPEILKNLTNSRLDFIHRFIRLWRKTAWSIPDLDLVLTALKEGGLSGADFDTNNGAPILYLARYWDRVEDRLFKIRHCMNISGVRRQLALFQPPIEPMALVRARAAGLSLEDILGMLAAPLPPYRFSHLIEKAKQFTQTVQNFGAALLSALEKKDVEELTLLRSVHERNILRLTKEIKKQQVKEAQYQYQAMVETKANRHHQDLFSA